MAEIKKISTELQLLDKFLDTSGDAGTSGQVLSSTGTGINWVSGGSLPGGPFLPLSAGSSYPLTNSLYLENTSGSAGASPSLYFKNGSGNFWRYLHESGGDFSIKEGTATRLTFKAGGNVGIGTTNPVQTLEIHNSDASGYTHFGIKGTGHKYVIGVGNDSVADVNDKLYFYDNDNSAFRLVLDTSGNVGIGTTAPDAPLHILKAAGGANIVTGLKLDPDDATTGSGISIDFNASTTNTGASLVGSRIVGAREGGNASGFLALYTSPDASGSVPLERMRIDSTGNVGIGTTSPREKLDVDGDIVTTWGNDKFVGLQYQQGAAYQNGLLLHGDNRSTGLIAKGGTGSTPYIWFGVSEGGNTERMRITKDGNVGIGTTAASSYDTAKIGSSHRFLNVEAPTGNYAINTLAGGLSGNGDRIGFLAFANTTNSATHKYSAWIGSEVEGTTANKVGGRLVFSTTADNSTAGPIERMRIDSAGAVKFNAYGAGYLQTDANGNITSGTVTTSDTLDDVTDNGNSTTNSIVLGASTADGTMLVRGTYTSGNIVVIGGMKSSGGAMIGYGVKPDTANNHGFVSSSAFTLERAAYYQQGNRHRWYAGASQDAAIGNAVTMSETMRLDFDKLGLSTSSPASLIHLGKSTNGSNIITFGEAGIGGPHGLDFYGDDATRTLKYSLYYRTGTENISMETSDGTKRFEITQSGAVTFNQAFTFPTADGGAGSALITDGSGALSWNAGYKQYSPVGWQVLNNQTKTANAQNISSNSSQVLNGTTPVQRNSATEFQATKQGWYEIQYSFIIKNNYTNRALVGAYMGYAHGSGGGVISGSHSTDYVRYNTYGEYAQVQNTYYFYAPDGITKFYLFSYLLSGSMNMTTQALTQSMISFRYINNDIT